MHLTRRDILRSGAALGTAALASRALAAQQRYFMPHSFIERNPKAVFIRRTSVAHKMDAEAKRNEGLKLARLIFVGSDRPATLRIGCPAGGHLALHCCLLIY